MVAIHLYSRELMRQLVVAEAIGQGCGAPAAAASPERTDGESCSPMLSTTAEVWVDDAHRVL